MEFFDDYPEEKDWENDKDEVFYVNEKRKKG